ncbi:MAG: efflux RND transporter periplasmic adaptor subunit [Panacagrimonas sp.]
MSLSLISQQATLRDAVRRLSQAVVAPIARNGDGEMRLPKDGIRRRGDTDLIGIRHPQADGCGPAKQKTRDFAPSLRQVRSGLVVAALVTLLGACGREPPPAAAGTPLRTWTLPLTTAAPGSAEGYAVTGAVVSEQRIDLASRLSGHIREMPAQEGDRVKRGTRLVLLDAPEVEAGVRQNEAALLAAQAALEDARTDTEAFDDLRERGSASDNEMRKTRLRYEAARAAFDGARVALDAARAQRPYADIRSPIDGWVVARHRRVGELVTPGVPLLTVESAGSLIFEAHAAQNRAAALHEGAPVSVSIDGLEAPLPGTIARVVPSADPVTRSQLVKIALPERPDLRPGMFGRARFSSADVPALVVGRAALLERGGLWGVFVVGADSVARFRWLRTGREDSGGVQIHAGLEAGERYVGVAEASLRDGDRVQPAGAPPAESAAGPADAAR